jgi:hypothetical protein
MTKKYRYKAQEKDKTAARQQHLEKLHQSLLCWRGMAKIAMHSPLYHLELSNDDIRQEVQIYTLDRTRKEQETRSRQEQEQEQ